MTRVELTCALDELRAATIQAVRFTARGPIPAHGALHLLPSGNVLRVVATNGRLEYTAYVSAATNGSHALHVPARLVAGWLRFASGATLQIEADPAHTTFRTERATLTLAPDPSLDWTPTPARWTDGVALPANTLRELLLATFPYAARGTFRPVLHAVALTGRGDRLRAVATDGVCLAIHELAAPAGDFPERLMPWEMARALITRLKPLKRHEVWLWAGSPNRIAVTSDTWHLAAYRVQGAFPGYQKILAAPVVGTITVAADAFGRAMRMLAPVTAMRGHLTWLDGGRARDVLDIAGGHETSHGGTTLAAAIHDEPGEIVANTRYLADLAALFPGQQLTLAITGRTSPLYARGDGDYPQVALMPMHAEHRVPAPTPRPEAA